jgi:hypothetical protein
VHYDAEPQRRAEYHRFVGDGMRPGYAAEDGVALHFRRTRLAGAVSSRPGGCAYRVEHTGDGVVETPLEVTYLGEAAPQMSAEAQQSAATGAAATELAAQPAEPVKSRRPRRRGARRAAPSAKAELLPVAPEPLPA